MPASSSEKGSSSSYAQASADREVLNLDLHCAKCGYNLRGLAAGALCAECGLPVRDSFDPLAVLLGRHSARELPETLFGVALALGILACLFVSIFFITPAIGLPFLFIAALLCFTAGLMLIYAFAILLLLPTPRKWIHVCLFALAVAIPVLGGTVAPWLGMARVLVLAVAIILLAVTLDLREIARRLGNRGVRQFGTAAVALAWIVTVCGALESDWAASTLGASKQALSVVIPTSIERAALVAWSTVQCLTFASARRMVLATLRRPAISAPESLS